jgi:hypothetical protein
MIRFLDTFSEFSGNSFDKSMEEKEERGLGDVPMMLRERYWEKGFSASIRNMFSGALKIERSSAQSSGFQTERCGKRNR